MRILSGLVVLLVPLLAWADAPTDARKAAIAYLRQLQNKDGGFRASADERASSLAATSAAARALAYLGGDVPNRETARTFVLECYDSVQRGFADRPGTAPDVRLTAVGVMAAQATGLDLGPMRRAALFEYLSTKPRTYEEIRIAVAGMEAMGANSSQSPAWEKQIEELANADGTWGKSDGAARDTGGSAVILLRLGVKLKDEAAVLKVLDAGQRPDGGFGKADAKESDLETTYRVMRCYHMLKKQPAAAMKVRDFVAKCQNKDGGYGTAPGQASSVSGTYFASSITHWLDTK